MLLTLSCKLPPNLSFLFPKFWRSSRDLSGYISNHFYDHLCKATTDFLYKQDISDEHPALEFLRYLETTAYDTLSGFILGRNVMYCILRWENMLNCHPSLEVDASYLLVSLSWHNFLGCGHVRFQGRYYGTSASFDNQNLSGNVMYNKISWWNEKNYYRSIQ